MLFLILFTKQITPIKPVILVPPLYGTNLHVSYRDTDLPWYCPKSMDDDLLWIDPKFLVPPRYNCVLQLLQTEFNNETGKVSNKKGVDITVHDFGGEESVQYVDGGFLGFQFFDTYASMLDYYKSNGYEIGRNLFTAPYDWRLAPIALYDFWPNMKQLVERAYEINNCKVTIMGFSCGGFTLHQFLAKHVKQSWKDKYVEKVVFLAPSFGGTMDTFNVVFSRKMPMLKFIHSKDVDGLIEGLPFVHSHYLNQKVYGDTPVVIGPDGENYTAKDLPGLLSKHNKISSQFHEVMKMGMQLQKETISDINLPTTFVYNSGYPTHFQTNFKNGWNEPPEIINDKGDGTIPSKAIEWACNNWDHKNSPKMCIDLENHELRFRHQPMSRNPFIHELLFNLTANSDWLNTTGKTTVRLPYVTINSDETYNIRNDIRPMSIYHWD